jgi:uncharacterized protein with NRDE domain
MCVLAIAWQAHPRWRLVVAANRDEFHDRPAQPLHRWPDGLIAGRDARAGGTWLAVGAARFAAVTNLRGSRAPDPARRSRGALVAGLATGAIAPAAAGLEAYNPFNAVLVDARGPHFLTNRPAKAIALAPGLHAMSNGPLDPPWRKTVRLTRVIERWLAAGGGPVEALFDGLRDPAPPAGEQDAAIFVADPVYGTRCSTVVTIDADGAGAIAERRYDASGATTGETRVDFTWR